MNENNENVTAENEEKNAIYNTSFSMSKDLYYDFCCVNYNRTKKCFLLLLCSVACLTGINLLIGNYDTTICYDPFISIIMITIYFATKNAGKIGYERMLISEGKERPLVFELFEDKIVSHNDESKREFFYHQITQFFETKRFILLHLQHRLFITIEKSNLNASADEVKAFLIKQCPHVKKKKFIYCANDNQWSLAFLIATIVVAAIGTVAGVILKTKLHF